MRAQHRALSHLERRPVAVVTDTSADLPDSVLDRHHIALVPLQILFGDIVFQDRVGIRPEEFYRRLRTAKELPTTSQLIRSGRVSRGKAWLAGMLDGKPILSLDQTGRIVPVDRVRGREAVINRMLALVDKALTPRPKVVRFGVVHAEAPEAAERVRTALVAAYRPRDCFFSLATGVLGIHVGHGAWALCWQVEDGAPTPPSGGRVQTG